MTPPKGPEFGGLDPVLAVGGSVGRHIEGEAAVSDLAELPKGAARALEVMQVLDGRGVEEVLRGAAHLLLEQGKSEDDVIAALSVFTTEIRSMKPQRADNAISNGVALHNLDVIAGALVDEGDTHEELQTDQGSDEALETSILDINSHPAIPDVSHLGDIYYEETNSGGANEDETSSMRASVSMASRIVAEAIGALQQKQMAEQQKQNIADIYGISIGEVSVVRAIAAAKDIDFEDALTIYRRLEHVSISSTDKSELRADDENEAPRLTEVSQDRLPEDNVAVDKHDNVPQVLRYRSRGRSAVAALVLLGVGSALIGGATVFSRDRGPELAVSSGDVDEIVDELLLDGIEDEESTMSVDGAAEANMGRGDRQAEDGFESVEDFFPAIDTVGETVTNYRECIAYVHQRRPVEERLPIAYAQATIYALMKYASDGYLENESRLNPDMQGLFARSPEYYNDRFNQIVGDQEAAEFRAKLEAATEQDRRTLTAYQQILVQYEDVRDYVLPGLNAFYETLANEGIDINTIPPEYEREAMGRLFLHAVLDGFGNNDRIAASTDGSKGYVVLMLEDMEASRTSTIDTLNGQSWNQGRMAAAAANPVNCSTEKLEELLGQPTN